MCEERKKTKMVIEDDSFIRPDSHKQSRSSPLPKPGSEFSSRLSPPSMSNLHDHEEGLFFAHQSI